MFVKHEEFGYGEILPSTEIVEEETVVSVDVMFEHGIERNVSTYDLSELDEEELQELSRNTLKNYAGKAIKNREMHIGARDYNTKKAYDHEEREYEAGMSGDKYAQTRHGRRVDHHLYAQDSHQKEIEKRDKGLKTVAKKLKEAFDSIEFDDLSEEELQELSKQTLGSYIKKASNDVAFKAYGAGSASGSVGGKFNKSEYDKKVEAEGNADRQKAVKRISGIKTATDKLVREDYQAPENVIKQILEAKIDVRAQAQIADFKSRL